MINSPVAVVIGVGIILICVFILVQLVETVFRGSPVSLDKLGESLNNKYNKSSPQNKKKINPKKVSVHYDSLKHNFKNAISEYEVTKTVLENYRVKYNKEWEKVFKPNDPRGSEAQKKFIDPVTQEFYYMRRTINQEFNQIETWFNKIDEDFSNKWDDIWPETNKMARIYTNISNEFIKKARHYQNDIKELDNKTYYAFEAVKNYFDDRPFQDPDCPIQLVPLNDDERKYFGNTFL